MKLIIQIPCYNEEESLPVALSALPRRIEGFDVVEYLVIDDGSDDDTARIAREHGVHHIVRHAGNKGLARAFMTGLDAALALGADVIVNTDADNQYDARDIPDLVAPILGHRAEMVIGTRPIAAIEHFSPMKKALQAIGSWVVRLVSGLDVQDAPSGFRAMSRDAACKLMVFSDYTYTLETLIQAGQKNISTVCVPVRVNPELRRSRLVKSSFSYVKKSILTIVRIFVIYRPFRSFALVGSMFFLLGLCIGVRFLFAYAQGNGSGHIQSLILAAILLILGFQSVMVAFLADLLAANRKILEDIRHKTARTTGGREEER